MMRPPVAGPWIYPAARYYDDWYDEEHLPPPNPPTAKSKQSSWNVSERIPGQRTTTFVLTSSVTSRSLPATSPRRLQSGLQATTPGKHPGSETLAIILRGRRHGLTVASLHPQHLDGGEAWSARTAASC
jgi:hypothetical protein